MARLIAEVADETGFPPGVLSVPAADLEVSRHLVDRPEIALISLTGGGAAATDILRRSADRLPRTVFELGGKSPAIVLDDADLDAILTPLVAGAMSGAGQPSRHDLWRDLRPVAPSRRDRRRTCRHVRSDADRRSARPAHRPRASDRPPCVGAFRPVRASGFRRRSSNRHRWRAPCGVRARLRLRADAHRGATPRRRCPARGVFGPDVRRTRTTTSRLAIGMATTRRSASPRPSSAPTLAGQCRWRADSTRAR